MESKELRIGNYVNGRGKYHSYVEMPQGRHNFPFGLSFDNNDDFQITTEYLFSTILKEEVAYKLNPIRITENWLIRFGFKKINNYFLLDNYIYKGDCFIIDRENQCAVKINYVHQLQNLYYSLTGN